MKNSNKKELYQFIKVLVVPVLSYLPAFLLVWLSFSVFRPATINPQVPKAANLEKQVEAEVKKQLALRRSVPQGELQKQISDEVQKVAKEEIENQENKVKGDLFSQISFPVLFAIASIFAAFAVKDILTEILKDQEKEKIQQELELKLRAEIVPKAIKTNRQELNDRVDAIEVYAIWLEHELLQIMIAHAIDEFQLPLKARPTEREKSSLIAIERLYSRSNIALDRISGEFELDQFKLLKQVKHEFFAAKIRSLKLEMSLENKLLSKLNEALTDSNEDELLLDGRYTRMEDIFQLQKSLFIDKLYKLYEQSDESQQADLERLITLINRNSKDLVRKAKEKKAEAKKLQDEVANEIQL
ncbi:hypothetical protein ACQ4M3_34370 [Leptolyngbya sp. AN03gr2]|uniref:hypothetical protein n=1 Tax=unclassified Leptolyngbya TaxID=2650499 RepID=UPI003D3103C1